MTSLHCRKPEADRARIPPVLSRAAEASCKMTGRCSSSTPRSISTNLDGLSASTGRIGGNDWALGIKHYEPIMFLSARRLKSGYAFVATRTLTPKSSKYPVRLKQRRQFHDRSTLMSSQRSPGGLSLDGGVGDKGGYDGSAFGFFRCEKLSDYGVITTQEGSATLKVLLK